jgi:hypothetical protein
MKEPQEMREVYHVNLLAQRLLSSQRHQTLERAVGAMENIRSLEVNNGWSSAFANGFTDGQAARDRNDPLTAYVRVGIDDYAKGFRQGFFNRRAPALHRTARPAAGQVVHL